MPVKIDFVYLFKAIEENLNLTVHFETEMGEKLTYRSRFFEVNREENYVIIDFPTGDHETFKPLVPHDNISILFKISGFRFLFDSEVLEKIEYRLNSETRVTAFKVRLPVTLMDGNRRDHFRVSVSMDKPIRLYYFVIDPLKRKRVPVSPDMEPDKSRFFEAVMIDLSGGGIAIKSGNDIELQQDTKLVIWFKLQETDNEFIRVEGLVRNARKYGEKEIPLWGVEFIATKDIHFKRALNRINQFVMATQREFLAKFR